METTTHHRRRVRPEDYDGLVEFYQSIIGNKSASLRMRLTAAKQLDAILTRIERREDAEARRAERERLVAAKARAQAANELATAQTRQQQSEREREEQREQALRRGGEYLQKILQNS